MNTADVLVLGGGLCGLTAAAQLGSRATVIERERRPGGLVRTANFGGYWFDHVLHLLHLQDPDLESMLAQLLGGALVRCPPQAWVETRAGTARFPLQMHLGHLDNDVVTDIIAELSELTYGPERAAATNYRELLQRSFGDTLFDLFFRPYNEKMWKRDLTGLGQAGFTWNLHRPDLRQVISGAIDPDRVRPAYNSYAFYPQPPAGSPVRGMETLTVALASQAHDLRTQHSVTRIVPSERAVHVQTPDGPAVLRWRDACLSTLPLPRAIAMCDGVPPELLTSVKKLRYNLVYSVGLRIRGPRPDLGHWRYYADPDLCFTRLVFLHAFDPLLAPADGWPLLAEITWPAEQPIDEAALVASVEADVRSLDLIPDGSELLSTHVIVADPAYVVFALDDQQVVQQAAQWLREQGLHTLGRYGSWEYSSMAS
ncbi:MAG: protoporphyrinogen oxidase, partial [Kiritimatiellia bacterium]